MPLKSLSALDPNARELAGRSTAWMDSFWDEAAGLLWYPGYEAPAQKMSGRGYHLVRDTAWYVIGLLLRRQGPDCLRAIHAMHAILDFQFDAPAQPFHGSFARSPEEPRPPESGAAEWMQYDPNWREFIITALQVALAEYECLLPHELAARIDAATRLAVAGALARPLRPNYSNIALMNAFMLASAGTRLNVPEWVARGEGMAQAVYDLFQVDGAFEEYNSPTYYGTDLGALAMWRAYGPTPLLRRLGAEMETGLWDDLSRFYHPLLHNQCGPYDRSYGMDMTRYAALLGEWIWLVNGPRAAPFPALDLPFAHTPDWYYAPLPALLGAVVSDPARARLQTLVHPRQVEQVITRQPRRVATAWLEEAFMWGGEQACGTKFGSPQFHPLTLHWRLPNGEIGWMRLVHQDPADAVVTGRGATLQASGPLVFQVYAGPLSPEAYTAARWNLPGITLRLAGAPAVFTVVRKPGWVELAYDVGPRPIQIHLDIS
jgi:hypothetical protein